MNVKCVAVNPYPLRAGLSDGDRLSGPLPASPLAPFYASTLLPFVRPLR